MQLTVEVILKEQAALAAKRDERQRRVGEATTGTDEGFNATMELVESGVKPARAEALVRATMLKLLRDDARVKQATAKEHEKAAKDLARREDRFAAELTGAYRRNRQPFGVRGAARRRAGKWLAQTLGPSGMDAVAGAAGVAGTAVMAAGAAERIIPFIRDLLSEQIKAIDASIARAVKEINDLTLVKAAGVEIEAPSLDGMMKGALAGIQEAFSTAEAAAAGLSGGFDAASAAAILGAGDVAALGIQGGEGAFRVAKVRARQRRELQEWRDARVGNELGRTLRMLWGGGK